MAKRGEHGFWGKEKDMGAYVAQKVKFGWESCGELRRYKRSGTVGVRGPIVFFVYRRPDQVLRERTAWAIDIGTVAWLRMYAVSHIGVAVTDGTKLLLPAAAFNATPLPAGIERSPRQFILTEAAWSVNRPPVVERVETIAEAMRV